MTLMIDIDSLHPKQAQMAKSVLSTAFRRPILDVVLQYARDRGDSAFLVMADEIDPLWWLLAKEGVDDRERARTEAVAEHWLADRCYGLGVTPQRLEAPPLSIECEYGTLS